MFFRMCAAFAAVLLVTTISVEAQEGGDYVVAGEFRLPDTTLVTEDVDLPMSPNREDVKAIGMGKAGVANGKLYNGMLYNPALLSRRRYSIDALSIGLGLPKQSIDAAKYVVGNIDEFKTSNPNGFLRKLQDGYRAWDRARTLDEKIAATRLLNEALQVPNGLRTELTGDANHPKTQGMYVIPTIQAQWGNWGAALYGSGQAGFQAQLGNLAEQLLTIKIPENPDEVTATALEKIVGVLAAAFDETGNVSSEALPKIFAVGYADIVGTVGHAKQIRKNLSLGANLKIVNRRFSTKNIEFDVDDIGSSTALFKETLREFKSSSTGFTFDLGALYRHEKSGTEIGVSLQNVIPMKKIKSTASFRFANSQLLYATDEQGNYPLINGNGDTLVVAYNQKYKINIPFALKTPFLANAGVFRPIKPNLDVVVDWVDMLGQDDKYDKYFERFRLGAEYRTWKSKLALRGGIADLRPTLGLGLNFNYFHA